MHPQVVCVEAVIDWHGEVAVVRAWVILVMRARVEVVGEVVYVARLVEVVGHVVQVARGREVVRLA